MQRETNPIVSFLKMDDGVYYIFELSSKDDVDILINMDQTDWRGYRIRVDYYVNLDTKTETFFYRLQRYRRRKR